MWVQKRLEANQDKIIQGRQGRCEMFFYFLKFMFFVVVVWSQFDFNNYLRFQKGRC